KISFTRPSIGAVPRCTIGPGRESVAQDTVAPPELILASAISAVARGADGDATLADLLRLATDASGADSAAAFLWDSERGGLGLAGSGGIAEDGIPALGARV